MKQLSGSDIQSMKSVDIKSVDKDTLADLNAVQIDTSKPVQERILSFLDCSASGMCL